MPLTPTCRVDADANVHDNMDVPEPVTLVGERVHDVLLVERLTTPAKLFRPDIVIVADPAEPVRSVTVEGAAAMVKS